MTELEDHELLADFARNGSETAFAALVSRHLGLVYSTALRFSNNPHHAQEIAQAVFIILARKAGGLSPQVVLSGWLYQTARLTAANFIKGEIRRQRREQEAYMQSTPNETDSRAWEKIAPLLDEAMGGLGETDRNAVVLRYFENKNAAEIGVKLRTTEETARKRVNRALEKLRKFFHKRGVASTTLMIAGAISANSVQAAPPILAKTISAIAITKGALAGSSTLTLVHGALKLMAWTKAKIAIAVTAGVLFAAGTTTVVLEKISHPTLSATDLSWADEPQYWKPNSRVLEKVPPVFILRPTRLANQGASIQTGQRFLAIDASVQDLLATAYSAQETRMIFPQDMPTDHLDLMLTIPDRPIDALQEELQKRYGLTAHRETRNENAMILKVTQPNAPGINISKGGNQTWKGGNHEDTLKDMPFDNLTGSIESHLQIPIINQTELYGLYDIHINYQPHPGESDQDAYKRTLTEQLGLELVPTNLPIEMLVVDKVNQ
jgi:uncharacterized protein (TIGR03435 family)